MTNQSRRRGCCRRREIGASLPVRALLLGDDTGVRATLGVLIKRRAQSPARLQLEQVPWT